MSDYDFVGKIRALDKEIKIHWERLLLKYKEHDISKDEIRVFKSSVLTPTLDEITDLTALVIERKREDLYKDITAFLKNVINFSTYYQRQTKHMGFNYSSETEHLGCLLPGYEATVRMFIIGSIAVVENAYDFISSLGDEQVIWLKRSDGRKLYRSIFYYPWYEDGWGASNLTNFFEDAKKKLSEDEQLKERYFSLIDDSYIDALCQFNFLQSIKIEILEQNDWDLGFPFYPNFARYCFDRVEDMITRFMKRDTKLLKSFPISPDSLRSFLVKYVDHIRHIAHRFENSWTRFMPQWFKDYLSENQN